MNIHIDPIQLFGEAPEGDVPDRMPAPNVGADTIRPQADTAAPHTGADTTRPQADTAAPHTGADTTRPQAAPAADPIRRHFDALLEEAEALRRRIPGFDLQAELDNPTFLRLTAPGTGISLEDAYFAVHRATLQQAAMEESAQRTAQQISNAIRSGSHRPQENGTGSHSPAVTAFDYRTASAAQRNALKKAIRDAGARGEKIYPGCQ